VTLKEYVKI